MAAKKRTKKKAGSSSRKHPAKKRPTKKRASKKGKRKAIRSTKAHSRSSFSGNANLVNYVNAVRAKARGALAAGSSPSSHRRLPTPWQVRAKNVERSTGTAIVPYRETTSAIVPYRPRKPKGRVYRAGPVRTSGVSDVVHAPFKSTTPFKRRVEELMATGLSQPQAWAQAMKERRSASATSQRASAIAKKANRGLSRSAKKKRRSKKKKTHTSATHTSSKPAGKKRRSKKKTRSATSSPASTPKRSGKKHRSGKKRHGKKKTHHHPAATPHVGKKKARRKGKRRHAHSGAATGHASPARHTRSKLSEKFRLMDSYGLPSKRGVSKAKARKIRKAAGKSITHAEIMQDIQAKKLVGWVCVGRVRTGCGGGSKMLRGAHQVGVIKAGKR